MDIRKNILWIWIIVIFTQCFEQNYQLSINSKQKDKITKKQFLTGNIKTDTFNIPIDSTIFYFPMSCFKSDKYVGSDTFVNRWYSKMLFALKEPLLFNKKNNNIVFRFTMLRTFNNPIVIRIERKNDTCKLIWKKSSGAGGYEPGIIKLNKEKKITDKDWTKFIDLINKSGFWDLPTVENDIGGFDGSEWILEGTTDDYYHVVSKWTPSGCSFYNCCDYLISLTDLEFIGEDEKY